MATCILKVKYETQDEAISHARLRPLSCEEYQGGVPHFEDQPEAPVESVTEDAAAPTPAPAAITIAAPVVAAPPAGGAASIEDVPLKAVNILTVVVAQKFNKKVEEIPLSKSVGKNLVGGNSTLQNEIPGDLQLKFTSASEKGEELPLEELGSALDVGHAGNMGKYSTDLVSRLIGSKMLGGSNKSAIKAYLSKTWGLGPQRADSVLLLAAPMEPPKRLGSEAEAKS